MNAVLKFTPQPTLSAAKSAELLNANVIEFIPASALEPEPLQAMQSEIKRLHAALLDAQRTLALHDTLLRNFRQRELVLRQETVQGRHI